jgi:hypothetical protein
MVGCRVKVVQFLDDGAADGAAGDFVEPGLEEEVGDEDPWGLAAALL